MGASTTSLTAGLFEEVESGARFSEDGLYRWELWRIWDRSLPLLLLLMLNPSKAGAVLNDPTVTRQVQRARMLGFGGLLVGNIFAYKSTDPRELYKVQDPVGGLNDEILMSLVERSGMVICAWGNHAKLHGRGDAVLRMIKESGRVPYCLRLTKEGQPEHPLYIPYSEVPKVLSNIGQS